MAKSSSLRKPLWVPPPKAFILRSKDQKEMDHLNELAFLSVEFKPRGKQPFQIVLDGIHEGAITQWATAASFGFVSSPKVALDKITIRFVSEGSIARRNSFAEYLGTPGKAMFVAFEEMVTEQASPGFQAFTGTVDRSALMACHVAFEGSDEFVFPSFEPVVDINGNPMRAFRHNFYLIYERLKAGVDENDLSFPLIQEMIIYQFLTAWPKSSGSDGSSTVLRPSWQVRRALDYIDANLQRKVTLAEIAAAASIGVRSLQANFRTELGKTPIQWIIERRLAGVHKELIGSDCNRGSVAAVARRWGFGHLGDFSRRYRERYGETPLKSQRGRG